LKRMRPTEDFENKKPNNGVGWPVMRSDSGWCRNQPQSNLISTLFSSDMYLIYCGLYSILFGHQSTPLTPVNISIVVVYNEASRLTATSIAL
jgi:hypothetical protein